MLDPVFVRTRAFHDRHARAIMAAIATMLVPLAVVTAVATLDNWRQDRERDDLLACFDDFAGASSTSSQVIREASVRKDVATAERDDALNAEGKAFQKLVERILTDNVKPKHVEELADTLADRHRAARKLDRAQAALDEARRENPVPAPPSEFCSVKP